MFQTDPLKNDIFGPTKTWSKNVLTKRDSAEEFLSKGTVGIFPVPNRNFLFDLRMFDVWEKFQTYSPKK